MFSTLSARSPARLASLLLLAAVAMMMATATAMAGLATAQSTESPSSSSAPSPSPSSSSQSHTSGGHGGPDAPSAVAVPDDPCFSDPSAPECANYVRPKGSWLPELTKLCDAMDYMPGCTLWRECQVLERGGKGEEEEEEACSSQTEAKGETHI